MNIFTYIGIYTVGSLILMVALVTHLALKDEKSRRREQIRVEKAAREATTPTTETWPNDVCSECNDYEVTNIEIVSPRHFPELQTQNWRSN